MSDPDRKHLSTVVVYRDGRPTLAHTTDWALSVALARAAVESGGGGPTTQAAP